MASNRVGKCEHTGVCDHFSTKGGFIGCEVYGVMAQVAPEWRQIEAENVSIQVYVTIFQRRVGVIQG